jgi:hypothetical protein
VVGRWGETDCVAASEGLSGVGTTHVAFTLADARDQILASAASAVTVTAATAKAADAEDPDLAEHLARAARRADDDRRSSEMIERSHPINQFNDSLPGQRSRNRVEASG